jgi:hypothetical protein
MRLHYLMIALLLSGGCIGKLRKTVKEKREDAPKLVVPAPPEGPSACELIAEAKKIDQGLQTQSPIPASVITTGRTYAIAWARTEAIENPDGEGSEDEEEDAPTEEIPEMGPLQMAKLSAGAKQATGVKRLTGERSNPKELEFSLTGKNSVFFFQDEIGVHLMRRSSSGKPLPGSFQVKEAYGPSMAYASKFGGIWLSWISSCGLGGELHLYKLPAKDPEPSDSIAMRTDGILCENAGTAMAAHNGKLALAWLVQGPPAEKKGKFLPNAVAFLTGDGEKGTFEEPIFLSPPNNPIGGPAITIAPDGKEAIIAWLVEGGAVGFAVVSMDGTGTTRISPQLLPGSFGAKDLAANIVADALYYGITWSTASEVWFGLLDRNGVMPTAPISLGKGAKPSAVKGFNPKEYSFIFWRVEESLIASQGLMFQQATCFAPKKKKKAGSGTTGKNTETKTPAK